MKTLTFVPPETVYRVDGKWLSADGIRPQDTAQADPAPRGTIGGQVHRDPDTGKETAKLHFGRGYSYEIDHALAELLVDAGYGAHIFGRVTPDPAPVEEDRLTYVDESGARRAIGVEYLASELEALKTRVQQLETERKINA